MNKFKKIKKVVVATGLTIATTISLSPVALLMPMVASAYSDGDLLKDASSDNIYVINNNAKVWIRSAEVFNACGYNWQAIKTVNDLASVPTADLIKAPDNPDVYRLEKNFKRKLASIEIFESYGLDWNKVTTVPVAVLNSYSRAPLIQLEGSADIYQIGENFIRRRYANWQAFVGDGKQTRDLITVNQLEFNSYGEDGVISEAEFITLTVFIEPLGAKVLGAWRLQGGSGLWYYSGRTIAVAEEGTYTIEFKEVSGYTTPENQTVTLTKGYTTVTATYDQSLVLLTVFIQPQGARDLGACWRLTTEAETVCRQNAETISLTEEGDYTITFKEIREYNKPADQTVTLTPGYNTVTGAYTKQYTWVYVTILPQEAKDAGAQWKLTTEATWHNSLEFFEVTQQGTYTIEFKDVEGWVTPLNIEKEVNLLTDTLWVVGTYQQEQPFNALTVYILPQGARDAGAQWQVVNLDAADQWHSNNETVYLDEGDHTIRFKEIDNWTKPEDISKIITNGYNTATGVYEPASPALIVTILPQGAIDAGAQWQVVNLDAVDQWHNSRETVYLEQTGTYTIRFKDVAGWIKPNDRPVIVGSGLKAASGTYQAESPTLTVYILPQEARDAGAQWQVVNLDAVDQWHNSQETVYLSTAGQYTIRFKSIEGWLTPEDASVNIVSGLNTATGVYQLPQPTLTVYLLPILAREMGARWRLNTEGVGVWHRSGETIELETGNYIIIFKEIVFNEGDPYFEQRVKPVNKPITIESGTNIATGIYPTVIIASK